MAPTPLRGGRVAIAAAIALACCMVVVLAQQPSTEQQMFSSLYRNVEQMVIPSYNSDTGAPTQVILFEMPGLAINRDEYDPNSWAAGGFSARQPDAVAATFVDRLPYYTGPTFVDSGSRISAVWSHFMYQYLIPIVDDPVQVAKVNEARLALANGTLQNNYDTASAAYAAAFTQFTTFRTNCLAKQPGGVCSYEGVIYRERLKRKWFSLEVARRDIAAAESKIIALQMQDLKTIFADALYAFASNERVDMGGAGFGASYYLTYFTPSSFWKWWPTTGIYDYSVFADGSTLQIALPASSAVVRQPLYGAFAQQPSGNYTYRPNAGYTGSDLFAYQVTTLVSGSNVTTTITKSIQVIGNDVLAADTAFVTVSCEAAYSSSSSSSASTSLSTSSSFRLGIGWFGASGSLKTSSTSSSSTSESLDSKTKISFDLARVSITRLWIDTSLLSFYPVAIRNLGAQSWSDGTITPATGALQFRFKLLPTAFLVARNIQISTTLSTTMSSLVQSASSYDGSVNVRVGPFFSGSTSVSQSSSARNYRESSSYTGGVMSVRGPQVIGWVCTPVPPFPTADEAAVRKWEADQIARQNVANNSTASRTPSSTSASTSGAKNTTASVQTTS